MVKTKQDCIDDVDNTYYITTMEEVREKGFLLNAKNRFGAWVRSIVILSDNKVAVMLE